MYLKSKQTNKTLRQSPGLRHRQQQNKNRLFGLFRNRMIRGNEGDYFFASNSLLLNFPPSVTINCPEHAAKATGCDPSFPAIVFTS